MTSRIKRVLDKQVLRHEKPILSKTWKYSQNPRKDTQNKMIHDWPMAYISKSKDTAIYIDRFHLKGPLIPEIYSNTGYPTLKHHQVIRSIKVLIRHRFQSRLSKSRSEMISTDVSFSTFPQSLFLNWYHDKTEMKWHFDNIFPMPLNNIFVLGKQMENSIELFSNFKYCNDVSMLSAFYLHYNQVFFVQSLLWKNSWILKKKIVISFLYLLYFYLCFLSLYFWSMRHSGLKMKLILDRKSQVQNARPEK